MSVVTAMVNVTVSYSDVFGFQLSLLKAKIEQLDSYSKHADKVTGLHACIIKMHYYPKYLFFMGFSRVSILFTHGMSPFPHLNHNIILKHLLRLILLIDYNE